MPIRAPSVNALLVGVCILMAMSGVPSEARAQVTGRPVAVNPGYADAPLILDAFGGRTLVAWRSFGLHASLLDSSGREAPCWPVGGVSISGSAEVFTQMAIKLSDSVAALVWTGKTAGNLDGHVTWLRLREGVVPTPSDLLSDSVTARVEQQSARVAFRQGDAHLLVSLLDRSSVVPRVLLKQIGLPGTDSNWPSGGVAIEDSISVISFSACEDGDMGCYVVTTHEHTCSRPPPPEVSSPCPADLKLFHLLADGSFDPAWPAAGILVSDDPGWDQLGHVVPDRQGGVFVVWHGKREGGWVILAQHYGSDGQRAVGWAAGGNPYPPTSPDDLPVIEGVASSNAGNLVILLSNYWWPWVVAVAPDGSLVPGWPQTGVTLGGGPSDQAYWRSGDYQLAVTPGGDVVIACTRFQPASNYGDDVWGAAWSADGSILPGWQSWGSPLCRTEYSEYDPVLTLSANGTFKLAWLDSRDLSPLPDTSPYVFFDHFQVADGAVPALAAARLDGYTIDWPLLRATWSVTGGHEERIFAVRSADGGGFESRPSLRWMGSAQALMVDSLPPGFRELRYALIALEAGLDRAISDTLVVSSMTYSAMRSVRCVSPTRERVIALDVVWDVPADLVVGVFDIAGRRERLLRVRSAGPSPTRISLDLASVPEGLYMVRAWDQRGHSAAAKLVHLR